MKKVYSYRLKCESCGHLYDVYYAESTHMTEQEFHKYMEQTLSVVRQKNCPGCKKETFNKVVGYSTTFKD